jgi:hypothetical protein
VISVNADLLKKKSISPPVPFAVLETTNCLKHGMLVVLPVFIFCYIYKSFV